MRLHPLKDGEMNQGLRTLLEKTKRLSGEYFVAIAFFFGYTVISLLGGLGFEQDTYSHVTLIQEIVGYRIALPFFGREYVWLPGYHYIGAFLYLLSAKTFAPLYVARFIASASSAFTLFISYRWLKILNVSLTWRVISVLLIGLNGYWIAYSTMSMTDTFSISLLIGWLYLLYLYMKNPKPKYLIVASILALVNVSTRYEAWVFMALSTLFLLLARSNKIQEKTKTLRRNLRTAAAFAIPSLVFIGLWLLYCFMGNGDPLYFTHEQTKFLWTNSPFYHNLGQAFPELFNNLLLVSGFLWLFPFLQAWKGNHRRLFASFSLLMFVYLLFLIVQLFNGTNAGFVRYWLPLLPLSSIAFGVTASRTKNKWLMLFCVAIIVVTVLFSIVGFQQVLAGHQDYLNTFGADENRL